MITSLNGDMQTVVAPNGQRLGKQFEVFTPTYRLKNIGAIIPELMPQVSFTHNTDPFKSFNPTPSIAGAPPANSKSNGN